MYASHNKDINRHKSFHPLTYRNLSRVERGLEEAEREQKAKEKRSAELRHDQEQRRYDDLVLASSADTMATQFAKFRQVENIFAAEADFAGKPTTPTVVAESNGSGLAFQKDPLDTNGIQKRSREDSEGSCPQGSTASSGTVTGSISRSDAVRLRKELDRIQKERHDPLRRVEQFQNRTVAAEAKRRVVEARARAQSSTEDVQKDMVRDRLQQLLDMKK
uniref:CBF1-interacting co-repressor CIR N-terminal domain-containing protein n=1 Tax=Trypanosoma congolense (strain IL3000) TaxID=1068625 RepID=G0UZK8_TRYCI|nr:conserved hypothetical protein [Trypanosoma congolense IL3000]